jgi:hypothetical protein
MATTRDLEKEALDHASDTAKVASHDSGDGPLTHDREDDYGYTPEEQRKIISRVDRRLVITVGAMYCVSLMDRTNLSAAAIAGMNVELNLNIENRYVSCQPRSLLPSLDCARGVGENPLTSELAIVVTAVDRVACVLHHLHPLPAAVDGACSQDRSPHPPLRHHHPLGRRRDRNGLLGQVC